MQSYTSGANVVTVEGLATLLAHLQFSQSSNLLFIAADGLLSTCNTSIATHKQTEDRKKTLNI